MVISMMQIPATRFLEIIEEAKNRSMALSDLTRRLRYKALYGITP